MAEDTGFKPGDRVRCVDDIGTSVLEVGEIYIVRAVFPALAMIEVEGHLSGFPWQQCRFEKVPDEAVKTEAATSAATGALSRMKDDANAKR